MNYNNARWLVFGRQGYCNLEWYIIKALINLGYDVKPILFKEDLITHYFYIRRLSIKKMLIREVQKFKPDVLLIIKGIYVNPKDLASIKKKCGCLVVHLMNDEGDDDNFEKVSLPIAMESDILFTAQDSYIAKYKEHGISEVHHFSYACDPDIHRSLNLSGQDLSKYSCDVSFAGTCRPERIQMVQATASYRPAVWGNGWRWYKVPREVRWFMRGGALPMDKLVKLYNSSKITLNMHKPYEIFDGTKANMRVFEATASGVLLITDRPRGLEEMFTPGKELICYDALEELPELVGYYLDNIEERSAIARNGQTRTRREHTYVKRVKDLVAKINYDSI